MPKILLEARGLKKDFKDQTIFQEIDFDIKEGDRIGLVGYNGAGKSTLAELIFGTLKPDDGTIQYLDRSLRMGYLRQSIADHDGELPQANHSLGFYEKTSQLGLRKVSDWSEERYQNLSGGERLKLALAGIWSENPHLLILDEPTNHLDFDGAAWLLEELKGYSGTVLIISHDRYFLDQAVSKIFELEDGHFQIFKGNYSFYKEEKARREAAQRHQYEVQQKNISRVESQIATLKTWAAKAHREAGKGRTPSENRQGGLKEYDGVKAKKRDQQIKSMVKRLEKELTENKIEKPKEAPDIYFTFESGTKRGKRIIEAKGLEKAYDQEPLFSNSHFYIRHGEHIGLFGPNGSGKTTLIRMILGQTAPTKGELWKSDSLNIAYLSQDMSDLPAEQTPLVFLNLDRQEDVFRARTLLANLGMDSEKISRPISELSLGERTRLKLASMLLKDYDLLILDEPTNHLDLPSREQLEDTLGTYAGTFIIVSHDRYFMERLCNKLLVFKEQKIQRMEMGLKEYWKGGLAKPADSKEKLMVIEHRLTAVLGELSALTPADPRYQELDEEFKSLLARKQELKA